VRILHRTGRAERTQHASMCMAGKAVGASECAPRRRNLSNNEDQSGSGKAVGCLVAIAIAGFAIQVGRQPTREEIQSVRNYAIQRGFDPDQAEEHLRDEVAQEYRPIILEPFRD